MMPMNILILGMQEKVTMAILVSYARLLLRMHKEIAAGLRWKPINGTDARNNLSNQDGLLTVL